MKVQRHKNLYIIIPFVAVALVIITVASYYVGTGIEQIDTAYKNKILRFHVIANSDSLEDQAIKEEIKNEILTSLKPEMSEFENIDNVKEFINANSEYIEEIAAKKLEEHGKDYSVKAYLDKSLFPIKTYGPITLPGGEYEALRIELGAAKGSNWWCILFPPLCFIDITQGLTTEKTVQNLQKVLTEKEIEGIRTATSHKDIPVEIRFKIVEIFDELGEKFASAIDKLDLRN